VARAVAKRKSTSRKVAGRASPRKTSGKSTTAAPAKRKRKAAAAPAIKSAGAIKSGGAKTGAAKTRTEKAAAPRAAAAGSGTGRTAGKATATKPAAVRSTSGKAAARASAKRTAPKSPPERRASPKAAARRAPTAAPAKRKAAAARKTAAAAQRFTVSHLNEADFKADGLRPYAQYRELGVALATGGLCQAHVIRFTPPCTDEVRKRHFHEVELQLVYVLKGWVKNEFDGHGVQMMSQGSCWIQPSGLSHTVLDYSADCELLEIVVPADFKTDEL
jgi:hypothetical protein